MQSNIKEGVIFTDPSTPQERHNVAKSCVRKLHIEIPALLDGIENRVEQQYTAWPDRLFVVDRGGAVTYKSEAGPFGFDPKKLESALAAVVTPPRQS